MSFGLGEVRIPAFSKSLTIPPLYDPVPSPHHPHSLYLKLPSSRLVRKLICKRISCFSIPWP